MNGAAVGVEGAGDGTLATGAIREAVAQLYFSSSCDTHAREEANQYLLAFTNDPTTTNVCLQLLGDSLSVLSSVNDGEQDGTHCGRSKKTEHTIAFFAANVLRTKVLKENVRIGENTVEHFINQVLRYASDFSTIDESVTRKLASVAATSAALSVKQQHHQKSRIDTDVALGIATNLFVSQESSRVRRCRRAILENRRAGLKS